MEITIQFLEDEEEPFFSKENNTFAYVICSKTRTIQKVQRPRTLYVPLFEIEAVHKEEAVALWGNEKITISGFGNSKVQGSLNEQLRICKERLCESFKNEEGVEPDHLYVVVRIPPTSQILEGTWSCFMKLGMVAGKANSNLTPSSEGPSKSISEEDLNLIHLMTK